MKSWMRWFVCAYCYISLKNINIGITTICWKPRDIGCGYGTRDTPELEMRVLASGVAGRWEFDLWILSSVPASLSPAVIGVVIPTRGLSGYPRFPLAAVTIVPTVEVLYSLTILQNLFSRTVVYK